jgi:hypothetical protein
MLLTTAQMDRRREASKAVNGAYVDSFRQVARMTLSRLPVVAPGLVALAMCIYQLALPHVLFGVHGDADGVYLAPALRLVHGVLPYRDYAFVQGPGITWLMAPLGLLGNTRDAMAATRIVTALVTGLNASLVAFAVRAYGAAAMLFAGLALAVFALAVSADHTLTLDPYLVLFCLLGTVVMFTGGELAAPRRIVLAGVLFGFAAAVKVWAVLPVVAALAVCVPLWRSALRPYVLGLALGFGVPSLPLFVIAPGTFLHDVFFAQLHRGATAQGFHSIDQRLVLMLGLTPVDIQAKEHVAAVTVTVLAAFVLATYFVSSRRCTRFEWFVLGAAAVVVMAMLFVVKDFYTYYSYFTAVFGVILLGICLGRLAELIGRGGEGIGVRRGKPMLSVAVSAVLPALVVIGGALVVPGGAAYARSYLSTAYDPQATISQHIPSGACVVADEVGNLIDVNRFTSTKSGCPRVVDAYGLWLTDNAGTAPPAQPPYRAAFVAKWRSWLERSDYAVLAAPQSDYVPWTPDLTSWFNSNYRLVASQPWVYVYQRISGA